MKPPAYFDHVRADAAGLWSKLQEDPRLKGPWVQLFQQVTNSPEHVLSELLQNADDSGATRAFIGVDGDALVVSHNGRDFSESDFNALCSFGLSNKGSLHTIGFRGIGFKSVFSVGPRVELRTPTLSVVFQRDQFTLPVWEDLPPAELGTAVRVPLSSPAMRTRLLEYLATWTTSPLSLLFFGSLRSLRVNGCLIGFREVGAGPVEGSAWYEAPDSPGRLLVLRSPAREMPKDALLEVRETRGDLDLILPPLPVQVVLGPGADGRLHVVLPTSISTALPFACNAPFLQDPARIGIKDPLLSPTNRWLLNQIGRLVGSAVAGWAGNSSRSAQDRVGAYALLPDTDGEHHDPQTAVVVSSLREMLKGRAFTLGADGDMHPGGAVLMPIEGTRDVWPASVLLSWVPGGKSILIHPECTDLHCRRIALFAGATLFGVDELLRRLQQPPAPLRPVPQGLQQLWQLCATRLYPSWNVVRFDPSNSYIVPAYGSPHLHRKDRVLRLGDVGAQVSPGDLDFLSELVPTADLEFAIDTKTSRPTAVCAPLLPALDLDRPLGVAQLLQKAGVILQNRKDVAGILRLGRIAGLADVVLDPTLPLVTEVGVISSIKEGVLGPSVDDIAHLFPDGWLDARRLTTEYPVGMTNDQIARWNGWAEGERAGLPRFPLPVRREIVLSRRDAQHWAELRRAEWPASLPLSSGHFKLAEHDFDPALRKHWDALQQGGSAVLVEVVRELAAFEWQRLAPLATDRLYQCGTSRAHLLVEGAAAWLRWLASQACIPDERGTPLRAAELLLGNSETEVLRGLEHFVSADLSGKTSRPLLLTLGVRETVSDAIGLLERLKSLAAQRETAVEVVAAIYRALDRIWSTADAAGRAAIREAFEADAIVFSSHSDWRRLGGIARNNPLNLPAIVTVHPELADTAFLGHCGLLDQPRREQVAEWLRARVDQGVLPDTEQKQAQAALEHLGAWGQETVGAILSLSGELRSSDKLSYLVQRGEEAPVLFPYIQRIVGWGYADVALNKVLTTASALAWLDERAQRRVVGIGPSRTSTPPAWLLALGDQVAPYARDLRFVEDSRVIAGLVAAAWCAVPRLTVELWDGDQHLGPPQEARAVWEGDRIFAAGRRVDHESPLADALAMQFRSEELRSIVRRAVGRDGDFIAELFEALGPAQADAEGALPPSVPATHSPSAVQDVPSEPLGEAEPGTTPGRGTSGPPPSSNHVPAGGAASAVAILGGGAGLSAPRIPRANARSDAANSTRRMSWVDPAQQWLRTRGFVRGLAGRREEHWSHPDGRSALLSRLPVHLMVSDADGAVSQAIHVLLQRPGKARTLPVMHETWKTLIEAGTKASLLIVHGDGHVLIPFSRIVRDGATYPSAYMVRLPDGLLDS